MSVFELPTVTLIPNGIHHPPIEDGRLLPNSVKEIITLVVAPLFVALVTTLVDHWLDNRDDN
ncbi:type I toxin-antitoxin system Fst family toxin [Enterococcus faecium]|uniref:type I toxin-antitoxin system Fst family toxin n=1 Tax=Enterococcus faecium TaxID=1352 RepID=UPI000CF2F0DD|nr:type I toxin-antitoxin system Fst family toxin [Enterococcus faecium]PQG49056.1 hypothetical protein CUS36_03550 [Enterococcus faecium]